jgi:hypothetical protein
MRRIYGDKEVKEKWMKPTQVLPDYTGQLLYAAGCVTGGAFMHGGVTGWSAGMVAAAFAIFLYLHAAVNLAPNKEKE